MPFSTFLNLNYTNACKKLREKVEGEDMKVTSMLASRDYAPAIVKRWMQGYGLFQGITTEKRNKITNAFLLFAKQHERQTDIENEDVLTSVYSDLHRTLFKSVRSYYQNLCSSRLEKSGVSC